MAYISSSVTMDGLPIPMFNAEEFSLIINEKLFSIYFGGKFTVFYGEPLIYDKIVIEPTC